MRAGGPRPYVCEAHRLDVLRRLHFAPGLLRWTYLSPLLRRTIVSWRCTGTTAETKHSEVDNLVGPTAPGRRLEMASNRSQA